MDQVTHNYLSFRVGQQWYGIDIADIIEVTYLVTLTELPAATPGMLGLITIRDEVMPVIDLRIRFKADKAPLFMDTPIICARSERGTIGLVVDEAEDVLAIDPASITASDGTESRYISGVLRVPDRLLLLLDLTCVRDEILDADLPESSEGQGDSVAGG